MVTRSVAILTLLGLLAAGCTDGTKPRAAGTTVREVNRFQFVEAELVAHPEDETSFNHYYMGSLDEHHYLSVRNGRYKIPISQLELDHSFPLTENKQDWVPMRVHFSHVVLKDKSNE